MPRLAPLRRRATFAVASGLVVAMSVCVVVRAASPAPALADAAMRNDIAAVRALLKAGANVNTPGGDGMTALHWAATKGNLEMARLLLAAHAGGRATTRIGGHTALHLAATIGNTPIVQMLLEAGADANAATGSGTTPVMLAAAAGDPGAVKALVAGHAKVNAVEPAKGHTALMFAAAANRVDAVKVLLEAGANSSATTKVFSLMTVEIPPDRSAANNFDQKARNAARVVDPNAKPAVPGVDRNYEYNELVAAQGGLTPLLFAARQGYLPVASALVEAGADINQVSRGVGLSSLTIAIVNGHFDLAMYLIQKGANPNLQADNGVAPLYAALNCQWADEVEYPQPQAYLQQKTSYLDLLKALLAHGADPNLRLTKKVWYSGYARDNSGVNEIGATAFWRAVYASDVNAARILLAYGADPTIALQAPAGRQGGGPGATAIHAATGVGYLQNYAGNGHRNHPAGWMPAVRFLVEELGVDVNAKDDGGNTPLHYAAARGDNEMIRFLVAKGADVKAVNRTGQTTADAANGPHQRVQPFPDTIALLESLGATNNHRCVSC